MVARTASAFACGSINPGKLAIVLPMVLFGLSTITAKADSCSSVKDEISTDRPDVTNSSLVVPAGSLQIDDGVNFSARDGDRFVDGTNTRVRGESQIVSNFSWTRRLILQMSAIPKGEVFPTSHRR